MAKYFLLHVISLILMVFSSVSLAQQRFQSGNIDFQITEQITDFELDKNGRAVRRAGQVPDRSIFSWVPTGENNNYVESYCSSDNIKAIFRNHPADVDQQAQRLQKWFNYCNKQIGRGFRGGISSLYRAIRLYYPMVANRSIKSLRLEMPRGDVLRGFIGMKRSSKPRPLVLVKCGIYCNADPIRSQFIFFMHLFDESPFHVISLANVSGSEYEFENAAVALGGLHDGRQLFEVAAALQHPNSPYKNKISSVHVMGISLGGQGALYAALFSSMNHLSFLNKKAIDSVLAYCPVVNLEKSMNRLFSKGAVANLVENYTRRHLLRLSVNIPLLDRFFNHDYGDRSELKNAISGGAAQYYADWTHQEPWSLAPLKGLKIKSIDDFFEANNFNRFYQHIRIPTLVLAASDDRLVRTNENTGLLERYMERKRNPLIKTLIMGQGDHCAFSEANGWRNMSMLKREFVLSHSPRFMKSRKLYRVPIESDFRNLNWFNKLRVSSSESIMDYNFKFKKDKATVRVELSVFDQYKHIDGDSDKARCSEFKPHWADKRDCFRRYSANISITKLQKYGFRVPQSRLEASIFTRFANTQFSILNAQMKNIRYSSDFPSFIQFEGF